VSGTSGPQLGRGEQIVTRSRRSTVMLAETVASFAWHSLGGGFQRVSKDAVPDEVWPMRSRLQRRPPLAV
jgi:hypothetical protein